MRISAAAAPIGASPVRPTVHAGYVRGHAFLHASAAYFVLLNSLPLGIFIANNMTIYDIHICITAGGGPGDPDKPPQSHIFAAAMPVVIRVRSLASHWTPGVADIA